MERRLDRTIENKEKVTMRTMMGVINNYAALIGRMRELESAITDAVIVFTLQS